MAVLDCRGMSCPQPVLETKKALQKSPSGEILVLVDNPASKENVRRFAESQGYRVDISDERGTFQLRLQKAEGPGKDPADEERKVEGETPSVVFIESDSIGRGSEELGRILMRSFLHTLAEGDFKAAKIIMVNSGVKLTCEGSEVLEDLRHLSRQGAEILSCGTCLDYFGLKTKLQVGRVSNMYEILSSLAQAGKVLKM
ncbi:MAG TPA: sulfurtransferase-like selenium metabolism protein YedF [Thermodesulfobacteriota bacterium]|nr:sulfurtransferase-like selenium metabolism protein YedF [Thermodesulfobacteriota bacterium]